MSKIQDKFLELKNRKEKALIAYIMVGFPNKKTTLSAIRGLVKGGADIIEVGFPFTDPIADGPVIQNASSVSLTKGTNLKNFFTTIRQIRKETEIPLVLMTYSNVLYHQGYDKFMKNAKKSGIDGIILPDMAIEESKEYLAHAKKNNLDTIFLISPNTSTERIKKIVRSTTGFLYFVSVFGTTGIKTKVQQSTINAIKTTKKIIQNKIPLGIGFGIYTPNDAKNFLSVGADAIIVGSAFLQLIQKTPPRRIENKLATFTKSLKSTTRN